MFILIAMSKTKTKIWAGCPVRYAVGVFGDRWSLLIIRDIMFMGKRHYSEFLNAGEGISTNILADRLHHLERSGIVAKHRDPSHGAKFVYILTEKGRALMPTLLSMIEWSYTFDEETEVPKTFAEALLADMQNFQQELLDNISKRDREILD